MFRISIYFITTVLMFLAGLRSANASDFNDYDFSWLDSDKKIYVLQNRKFKKDNNFYISTTLGRSLSGAFIDSNEINFNAGYFFTEDWGLEYSYTIASGQTNSTHDGVNEQGAVAFYRKMTNAQTLLLMWSPFYSKINTFNKIFYFDWLFGLGVSSVTTEDNRLQFQFTSDDTLTSESAMALSWMTGFRFYINNSWSTRIDFRAHHLSSKAYLDDDEAQRWFHYYNINLGINYTF